MRVPAGMQAKGRSCSAAIEATSAWVPSPPAAARPSAPAATASRTSCSRSSPGFSSIGSIPRARASSGRLLLTALPPPDLGFHTTIARFGGSAAGSTTRTVKTRPSEARAREQERHRSEADADPLAREDHDDRGDQEEHDARQQDVVVRSRAVALHATLPPRRRPAAPSPRDHGGSRGRSRRRRRRHRPGRAPAPPQLSPAGRPLRHSFRRCSMLETASAEATLRRRRALTKLGRGRCQVSIRLPDRRRSEVGARRGTGRGYR